MWVAGFATYLTANIIGSVFSIGYLPIVILAPIGAMGLVFNAIAARIVLGDPFSKRSVIGKRCVCTESPTHPILFALFHCIGTLLIVIGALLVGLFGVIPEPDHDIDDLIRLYKRPAFIAYFSVLETFIITTILVSHYAELIFDRMEKADFQDRGKWLGQWISPADFKMCIGIR
jgi:drug/metabolite transporter (DMT)-like permease